MSPPRRNSNFARSVAWVLTLVTLAFALEPFSSIAAPLTYTSNTTVSLSSPAINFTIASGSVADSVVVNAGNVVVTMSSSTGGNFSLTSASRDLTIASSSVGGTVSQNCSSGVASTTISQSTASSSYTITPTASACVITISNVAASPPSGNGATITWTTNYPSDSTVSYGTTVSYGSTASGSSGVTSHSVSLSSLSYSTTYHYSVSSAAGTTSATSSDATFTTSAQVIVGVGGGSGGGGGGSGYYVAPATPPPAPATTTPAVATTTLAAATSSYPEISPQNQLNALMATLRALIAQANQQGIPLPSGIQPAPNKTPTFSRNLYVGSRGYDVKSLQLFLISQNSGPSAQKLAAVGANGRLGPLTRKALIEFQKSVGIKPANGNFGPKTRAYINSLNP